MAEQPPETSRGSSDAAAKSTHSSALVGLLLAVAGLAAAPLAAQETRGTQVHFGEATYRLFCAGCHGVDGKGSGEVADALDMSVGDLTQIRRRNGGDFPADAVADAITGRGVSGHRELAIEPWTEMFEDEFARFAEELAVNAMVARRIAHLVAYLESIQE